MGKQVKRHETNMRPAREREQSKYCLTCGRKDCPRMSTCQRVDLEEE